ncbi:MAG: glycosyltransferase family 39 protein [Planctomycetes bacterium]|nr:glycosyltransferase family 39 protein [Planctomycetota bacterium]
MTRSDRKPPGHQDAGRSREAGSLESPRIRAAAFVLALDALLVLAGQVERDLTSIDDLREAEVAREMFRSGDFVVPHLAGLPFLEKPPGYPAVVATAYGIAGKPSVPAARLVSAAFALAALAAVFLLGRRAWGVAGGAAAATALALSVMFVRTSHEILLDNALTACVAWALFFAWRGLDSTDARRKRESYAGAAFAAGLSFLMKGLVGPAILAAGLLLYLVAARRWRELKWALHPLVLLAFLAPVAAWVVPFLRQATPEQRHEFFVSNHLGRAAQAYASHDRPPWHYLATIWYRFAPGALVLPLAVAAAWRGRRDSAAFFALCMSVGPLLLLSASRAKCDVYLLPAYPAFAALVAGWVVGVRNRAALAAGPLAAAAAAGGTVVFAGIRGGLCPAFVIGALVLACGLAALPAVLRRREPSSAGVLTAALLVLIGVLAVTGPVAQLDIERQAGWRPGVRVAIEAGAGREILLYRPDDRIRGAFGFYRDRTAPEVVDEGDLVGRLAASGSVAVTPSDAGGIPKAVLDAAAARGIVLREELRVGYHKGWLVLFRAVR